MTGAQAATALERCQDWHHGQVVRVANERGTFRVTGYGRDGSVTLWGGPVGHEAYRSVMPVRLRRTSQSGPSRNPNMAAPAFRRVGRR